MSCTGDRDRAFHEINVNPAVPVTTAVCQHRLANVADEPPRFVRHVFGGATPPSLGTPGDAYSFAESTVRGILSRLPRPNSVGGKQGGLSRPAITPRGPAAHPQR